MKIGLSLLGVHPDAWLDLAQAADELGYESLWISDHMVLPRTLRNDVVPGRPIPINARTPVFDVWAYLAAIAARTTRLRLGTYVYQLALRHPFEAARSIATVDVLSGGRLEVGIGAGYVRDEWAAAGLDFASRGRRLDEALAVCKRLWTEEWISHTGEFFCFDEVGFEPKPVQRPTPPILVGGSSDAALRRAARQGDGWIAPQQGLAEIEPILERLRTIAAAADRHVPLCITAATPPGPVDDIVAWQRLGVDRLIVRPWESSRGAMAAIDSFIARLR